MTRFNAKIAAAVLIGLGSAYLVLAVVSGHSARAEALPDLSPRPSDLVLDVWKTAALMADEPRVVILDVRPADAFVRYHVPRAVSAPGATPELVESTLRDAPAVVVYAGKDEVAQRLVTAVKARAPAARVHYLADGARAWYLALQLPVPLFADGAPPAGYVEAMRTVSGWLDGSAVAPSPRVAEALQRLAKLDYQPTLLKTGKKVAGAGGGGKKISGGCG